MKWLFGEPAGARLHSNPGPRTRRMGVIAPICMLGDLCVSFAAIGGGASVSVGQAAGFLAAVLLQYWWIARFSNDASARPPRWRLVCSLMVVMLLIFTLRSGLIELLVERWLLPRYAGLPLAVLASSILVQCGYGLCLSAPASEHEFQWRALVGGVVGYAFLLRLVYSAQVELLPEEAYYWNYSRHLDIGYLDHPPMVAWLIRAGTMLFGDTEFGVRFGALCCGVTASCFLYRLTRNIFGEPSALVALALSQVLPFFFMAGMLMTPDAPLTAAWAAALYFFERALIAGRSSAWLWAGAALGGGLLSKYTIVLLGIAAFGFMWLDPASRQWFRRWQPYAAVLLAAAVFTPVIVWNYQHDWASFAFQTSRRLAEHPRFSLHKLIGGAMVLITPTGVLAVAAAFFGGAPQGAAAGSSSGRAWRFLRLSVCVPLTVFFFFSLRHEVKLDWTGAPWVAAVPVLAFGITRPYANNAAKPAAAARLRPRRAWPATVIVLLLLYGTGLYYLVLGIPSVGNSQHTELIPLGWRDFGAQIERVADDVRATQGGKLLIVGMDRYAIASELAFYSGNRARSVAETSSGHLFNEMGLMYAQWFPVALQEGRTLLLVAWDAETLETPRLAPHVSGLDPLRSGSVSRNGRLVRRFYYRVAHGYRPLGQNER